MDGIKKKMIAMKLEKENAMERAVQYEELLKKKEEEREKRENEISELNTKMKQAN
uniref:Tropomyosin n=1 Tax=Schistosoma japonicum TaxID=6182 RepID=C1LDB4_SCHJA|nr:Tropomyosin [Schistosoma japonicum]